MMKIVILSDNKMWRIFPKISFISYTEFLTAVAKTNTSNFDKKFRSYI